MKIYAGTSGYSYEEWKGIFYPEKISPKEMLHFYSERFETVEINNTFYRMPSKLVLTDWTNQVPDDFIFAFKAPQVITHVKRLRNVVQATGYLLRALSVLAERLGPVLFQFPPSFQADYSALKDFLAILPTTVSFAFEFRNTSWIDSRIIELLGEKRCSLCLTDSGEAPADRIISTTQWGYLRLRRTHYTDDELFHWMKRILSQEWEKAFVFFKHGQGATGPEMAMRFRSLARQE
ncbi:MAG TPA: DUF72 domain-containing protein [Deltaproteobacteria bacterium]|nr:DUF72 domain-containing protein [Deltaproteobacteria bacterium]